MGCNSSKSSIYIEPPVARKRSQGTVFQGKSGEAMSQLRKVSGESNVPPARKRSQGTVFQGQSGAAMKQLQEQGIAA
jgi:hypothetical protein